MKGRWLNNKEIDHEKWDSLVESSDSATLFSTSHYLNATCENWSAFIDPDYTFGFPVGVTTKMGVNSIFPPFFHRYSEIIGDQSKIDFSSLVQSMRSSFSTGVLHSKTSFTDEIKSEEYVFQTLSKDDYKLKTQAKRMIKKFEASGMEIEINNSLSKEVLDLVKLELSKKMDVYSGSSSMALDRLITDLPETIKLKTVTLKEGSNLVGGLLALEYKNTLLYLKGTTTETAKEQGGMYALMNHLILNAFDSGKIFDFGGSRVKGVRFFNTRFNAQDKTYFCYHWDHSPGWYKFLKLLNQWRKK